MFIELLRILLDFGLLVLIWMVQLLVYPSFLFYSKTQLLAWHSKYVKRISYIVMPLMFGQVMITAYQLYQEFSFYTISSGLLILVVWMLTFGLFVPRHHAISNALHDHKTLSELVSYNWLRTAVWTIVFVCTLITRV